MVIVRHAVALEVMIPALISAVWGKLFVKTATVHIAVVRGHMITAHTDAAVEISYERPPIIQHAVAPGATIPAAICAVLALLHVRVATSPFAVAPGVMT